MGRIAIILFSIFLSVETLQYAAIALLLEGSIVARIFADNLFARITTGALAVLCVIAIAESVQQIFKKDKTLSLEKWRCLTWIMIAGAQASWSVIAFQSGAGIQVAAIFFWHSINAICVAWLQIKATGVKWKRDSTKWDGIDA